MDLRTMFVCLIYLFVLAGFKWRPVTSSADIFDNVALSCHAAHVPDARTLTQCYFVSSWQSARLYDASNFTYFDPGEPMKDDIQQQYADYLYRRYLSELKQVGSYEKSRDCVDLIKIFACLAAFPQCPIIAAHDAEESYSYLPPCRLMCEIVNAKCLNGDKIVGDDKTMSCEAYTDQNCIMHLPDRNFLITDFNASGDLSYFYFAIFAFWSSVACVWNYLTFYVYQNVPQTSIQLSKLLAILPNMKAMTLLWSCIFWYECFQYKYCDKWLAIAVINCQLLYEIATIFTFIVIAKGWSIVKEDIESHEWRQIWTIIILYYIVMSLLLIIKNDGATQETNTAVIICAILLYTIVYAYLLYEVKQHCEDMSEQIEGLTGLGISTRITKPIYLKARMYNSFFAVVLLSFVMEFALHCYNLDDKNYDVILISYELFNIAILIPTLLFFRPLLHSPFFFMIPSNVDNGEDTAFLIESNEEEPHVLSERRRYNKNYAQIELINREDTNNQNTPARMIVIRNPNSVHLGENFDT